MDPNWFVQKKGKEFGPFNAVQMQTMAAQGQIAPDDQIRRSDQTTWVKASTVNRLFGDASNIPAPPPISPPFSAMKPAAGIPKPSAGIPLPLLIIGIISGAFLLMIVMCCGLGFVGRRGEQRLGSVTNDKPQDKRTEKSSSVDASTNKSSNSLPSIHTNPSTPASTVQPGDDDVPVTFPTFQAAAGLWKCKRTGRLFKFTPRISIGPDGEPGIARSVFVKGVTAPFDVVCGVEGQPQEEWGYEFFESGIVFAIPHRNVKVERGRIGEFTFNGDTLHMKLALTASRSDLGKIPWEFEYELVRQGGTPQDGDKVEEDSLVVGGRRVVGTSEYLEGYRSGYALAKNREATLKQIDDPGTRSLMQSEIQKEASVLVREYRQQVGEAGAGYDRLRGMGDGLTHGFSTFGITIN